MAEKPYVSDVEPPTGRLRVEMRPVLGSEALTNLRDHLKRKFEGIERVASDSSGRSLSTESGVEDRARETVLEILGILGAGIEIGDSAKEFIDAVCFRTTQSPVIQRGSREARVSEPTTRGKLNLEVRPTVPLPVFREACARVVEALVGIEKDAEKRRPGSLFRLADPSKVATSSERAQKTALEVLAALGMADREALRDESGG